MTCENTPQDHLIQETGARRQGACPQVLRLTAAARHERLPATGRGGTPPVRASPGSGGFPSGVELCRTVQHCATSGVRRSDSRWLSGCRVGRESRVVRCWATDENTAKAILAFLGRHNTRANTIEFRRGALRAGLGLGWESLLYARSALVNSATAAGLPAIDAPVYTTLTGCAAKLSWPKISGSMARERCTPARRPSCTTSSHPPQRRSPRRAPSWPLSGTAEAQSPPSTGRWSVPRSSLGESAG